MLSAISLLTMLLVSLSETINETNMGKSLLQLSGGSLLMVELFLLSAASPGSCFAILQSLKTTSPPAITTRNIRRPIGENGSWA